MDFVFERIQFSDNLFKIYFIFIKRINFSDYEINFQYLLSQHNVCNHNLYLINR